LGVVTLVILMSRTHQISARIPEMRIATDLKSFADQFPDRVVVLYFHSRNIAFIVRHWIAKVLGPILRGGDYEAIAQFYRVQQDEPETKLTDFDGKKISNRDLIQRYQVEVTPTIIFLGPDGREVASSIVGFLTVDFYGAYLDQSIQDGRTHLLSKTN
jgi:thioredoxin-related protein